MDRNENEDGTGKYAVINMRKLESYAGGSTFQRWTPAIQNALRVTIQRLRGVVIENRDALDCMRHHDTPDTLHYADPPYVFSTRSDDKADYPHEMSDDQHASLAAGLASLKGMVIVSGYRSDHYDEIFKGWRRVDKQAHADGAAKRIESLWLSPNMPAPGLELEAA